MGDVFRLNEPSVMSDILNGDIILVHFASGLYYHVRGVGASICEYLFAGGDLAHAAQLLADHFKLAPDQVLGDASRFVESLLTNGLLVKAEFEPAKPKMRISVSVYQAPSCEKFDDMADQLLLDKIDDPSQNAEWTPSSS